MDGTAAGQKLLRCIENMSLEERELFKVCIDALHKDYPDYQQYHEAFAAWRESVSNYEDIPHTAKKAIIYCFMNGQPFPPGLEQYGVGGAQE